jgi:hypothetical protein
MLYRVAGRRFGPNSYAGRGPGGRARWTSSVSAAAALDLDFTTGTLDPRITFARAGNAMVYDDTGKLTWAPNNLLTDSNNFGSTFWNLDGVTRSSGVSDPDGGTSAWTITSTASASQLYTGLFDYPESARSVCSIWVRRRTGTSTVALRNGVGTSITITPTGTWQRLSVSSATSNSQRFAVLLNAVGDAVDIYCAQAEAVTYQTTPRAYVATTSAAYYGPRFDHDPVTLAAKGLLIEESRTNLLTYSSQFDNAAWIKDAGSVTANAATAPDGTVSADKLVENGAVTAHPFYQGPSVTNAATPYTASFYVKAAERNYAAVQIITDSVSKRYCVVVDLATGVVTSTSSTGAPTSPSSSVSNAGNGWWRIAVTATNGSGVVIALVAPSDSATPTFASSVPSYSGDGTSGIYAWGAQCEEAAFATSYIPTTSAAVTRAAETASMTGTNFSGWYSQTEGTFVAEAATMALSAVAYRMFLNTAGAVGESFYLGLHPATLFISVMTDDSVPQTNLYGGTPVAGEFKKVATAYKLNDFGMSIAGGAAITGSSGTIATMTYLAIGNLADASMPLNGWIKSLVYHASRKTNAELVTLTTPPTAKMFVFAGQSNADNSTGTQGRYGTLDPGIKIWRSGAWATYDPTANASNQGVGFWGFEAEFLYQYRLAHPTETIYAVKQATGATTLAFNWKQDGSGAQWNGLVSQYNAAKANLQGSGYSVTTPSLSWMQGEADAGNGDTAPAYEANLTTFFASVRTLMGAGVKIDVGRIANTIETGSLRATVRAAQAAVVTADGNAVLINTDAIPHEADDLHFLTPTGVNQLGLYFYQADAGTYVLGPTITSTYKANLAEGDALSHSLTADRTVTWTKTGGADAALFSLAGSTLSMTARDYETPTDADADNIYVVQVTATDAGGATTNQIITFTVTDVAEGGAATTWNPADKAADIVLTNGNLTAGSTSGSFESVRGTTSKSSGKWYFEMGIVNTVNSWAAGVASATANISTYLGSDTQAFVRFYNGDVYNNNSVLASQTPSFGSLMVAVDLDADKIWFGQNGVWAGDPAAGTGGLAMTLGTVFPGGTMKQGDTLTLCTTTGSLAYTVPTGFTVWG